MASPDLSDITRRNGRRAGSPAQGIPGLRTGRASSSLLEPVTVEAYGSQLPITQVGTISVPEPRLIIVQVWDKSMVKSVEKAIREANLGLNPQSDGQTIRVPLPDLTRERRQELAKVAHRYSESARVAVRNIRRDGMDMLKRMEKDGDMSEDELHGWSDKVQALTDGHIRKIDENLAAKEQEIMQV